MNRLFLISIILSQLFPSTQYLTNEDGRKIALYDNGTWEYIDVNHPGE